MEGVIVAGLLAVAALLFVRAKRRAAPSSSRIELPAEPVAIDASNLTALAARLRAAGDEAGAHAVTVAANKRRIIDARYTKRG